MRLCQVTIKLENKSAIKGSSIKYADCACFLIANLLCDIWSKKRDR